MQTIGKLSCKWSRSILYENGWKSPEELIEYLRSVSETKYAEKNLPDKSVFIQHIQRLIVAIELDGDAVKEGKQMTSAGSIFESLSSDYLFIRSRYLQKRTKLKEQLKAVGSIR